MKKTASKSLVVVEKGRRVSQQDAKIEKPEVMADAFRKTVYGRRYATAREAYELASGIEILRTIVVSPAASAYRRFEDQDMDLRAWAAKSLLSFAISSTTELRRVADALDAVEAEIRQDPR